KMVTPIELWPAASKLQADIRRFCTELGIDVPDFQVLPCCQDEPAFVGTSSKKGTVIIGQKQLKLPYDQALSIVAHELGHAASPWLHRRMHSRALFDAAKLYIGAPFVMLSRLFGKRAQRHVIIAMDRFSELLLRPARLLQAKLSRDAEYRSDAYAAAKTSVDATIEALKSGRKPRMARMRHEIHTPIGVMIIVGEGMISPREDTSPTRSHPLLKRRIAALEALRDNDKTD
ncbi:MAG: M48 family metalloprotease, partial [Gammaproteobacteria bacterium]|nr:M48 family metalloprotease [Gammaproteobacteria bacterium]